MKVADHGEQNLASQQWWHIAARQDCPTEPAAAIAKTAVFERRGPVTSHSQGLALYRESVFFQQPQQTDFAGKMPGAHSDEEPR